MPTSNGPCKYLLSKCHSHREAWTQLYGPREQPSLVETCMGLDAATLALKENCITSLQMLSDRHLAVVPESLQKRQEEERLAARREKRRLRREAVIAIEETPHEVEVAKVQRQQK